MASPEEEEAALAHLAAAVDAAPDLLAREDERAEAAKRARPSLPPSLAAAAARQDARERAAKVLQDADLTPPEGFDGEKMWAALKMAFDLADRQKQAATVPALADINVIMDIRKAAEAMRKATEKLWARDNTAGVALALQLRSMKNSDFPNSAGAAMDFLLRCPEAPQQLATAAKLAVEDMEAARAGGPAHPRAVKVPEAGWLVALALPWVFTTFLRQKPTFAPDSDTSARSPCVRFIQAVHVAMKRHPPSDDAVMQTVRRWKAATST